MGFGLPLLEAEALGVPVLCTDLPVLREVGGEYPIYLPEGDLYLWRQRIETLARGPRPPSVRPAIAPGVRERRLGDRVEGIGVRACECRRAGEGVGDPRPEFAFHDRQYRVAHG